MFLKALDPNRNKDYTWLGQHVFTKVPAGSGIGDGSVYINPPSGSGSNVVFGVAVAGVAKLEVEAEGDVICGRYCQSSGCRTTFVGPINDSGSLTMETMNRDNDAAPKDVTIRAANAWASASGQPNGAAVRIYGGDPATASGVFGTVEMGTGVDGQETLGHNTDWDCALFKRDVDGGSSYSEAGSVVVIQRDVTNVTSEDGNFLECQNAAGAVLADIDKSGALEISAGFGLDVSPQAQQAHIVDADGQLADITTKFNTLLADLEGFGFLAAA